MTEKLKRMVTFWDGCHTPQGVLLTGGLDAQDGTDHTVVILLRSPRREVWTLEWKVRIVLTPYDSAPPLLIGLEGEVCKATTAGLVDEPPIDTRRRPEKFGALLGGHTVERMRCVAGYRNQVYRRDDGGDWTPIDDGLPGKSESTVRLFGLESIDGFSPDDLYAVGLHGAMWRRHGGTWISIASPTNVRLTSVHCSAHGTVYACGQHGVVLRGREDDWEVIADDPDMPNLWDVSSADGEVFVASDHVLYRLTSAGIQPVPFPDYDLGPAGIPTTFFRLSKAGERLLSIGPKDVLEFSAGTWRRLV